MFSIAQPGEVQQRVRDFLFYPDSLLPSEERDEAKAAYAQGYPTLLPPQFQFAHGDSLFIARDYPEIFSLAISQEPATKDLLVKLVNVSPTEQKYVDSLAGLVPQSAFRCQFGKRAADGEVKNLSDEITLNLRTEHNPSPPADLSPLAPHEQRTKRIAREVIIARIPAALARASQSSSYDSVRFFLSVALDADLRRYKSGKTAFLDLGSYRKAK